MTKFDLYFPRIMGAAFLAAMLFGGCASERAVEGKVDRFGNARSVQISCQDGAGKTVYETNVDNFGCSSCTENSAIINEGRCVRIAHESGNIFFCGYACSVVPLEK